jgi:hypothetical protein
MALFGITAKDWRELNQIAIQQMQLLEKTDTNLVT